MPRETDTPDRSTLSLPELDPLLNSILAQNMSRWAAVYFASAPENREQAVLQLLRQLEAEDAVREDVAHSPAFIRERESAPEASSDSQGEDAQLPSLDCQACGQENPADNNFCSMCGALLENQPASGQRIQEVPQAEAVASLENQPSNFSRPAPAIPELAITEPAITPRESSRMPTYHEVRSSNHAPRFGRYSEPASNPYRVYILAAVAILAPALLLIAWRGRQTTPASSPAAAQVPPAIPSTVTEQPATLAPTPSTPDRTASRPEPPDETTYSQGAPAISSRVAEKLSDKAAPANGSEELAIGLSFLNSAGGKQRNSEEAVAWLWKAVAKRNADATLRLSDLYLKGDGVAKNCDQARVLLDAAASRGISGAAERLRHLQSFGCE